MNGSVWVISGAYQCLICLRRFYYHKCYPDIWFFVPSVISTEEVTADLRFTWSREPSEELKHVFSSRVSPSFPPSSESINLTMCRYIPVPICLPFCFNFQVFIAVMAHYQHSDFLSLYLGALSLMRWSWGGVVVWCGASDVIWPSSQCWCKSPTHAALYVTQRSINSINKQLKQQIPEDISQFISTARSTLSTLLHLCNTDTVNN